jgi:hypothetical protein
MDSPNLQPFSELSRQAQAQRLRSSVAVLPTRTSEGRFQDGHDVFQLRSSFMTFAGNNSLQQSQSFKQHTPRDNTIDDPNNTLQTHPYIYMVSEEIGGG